MKLFCQNKIKKDILEINKRYVKNMIFHYVDNLNDVINIALLSEKVKRS